MSRLDDIFTDDANNIPTDIDKLNDLNDWTGKSVWNAIYTVQLGELVECGLFEWSKEELNWLCAAYDTEQYARVCEYFIQRFMYREISIEPFLEWAITLKRKLVYELMPKYKPLYERVAEGVNPYQLEDEYYKRRTISSEYPETLLSKNADYISDGIDEEWERLKEGKLAERLVEFAAMYKDVDQLLCDELESMFIGLYTMNVNVL